MYVTKNRITSHLKKTSLVFHKLSNNSTIIRVASFESYKKRCYVIYHTRMGLSRTICAIMPSISLSDDTNRIYTKFKKKGKRNA